MSDIYCNSERVLERYSVADATCRAQNPDPLISTKHQCTCSDCGTTFILEDALWCEHHEKLGIGTKECPYCRECICNGNTVEEIQKRFQYNINIGKFVKAKPNSFGWKYMCRTVKEVSITKQKEGKQE